MTIVRNAEAFSQAAGTHVVDRINRAVNVSFRQSNFDSHLLLLAVSLSAQRSKLIEQIKRNPRDVRFDDACKVAEWLGFSAKATKGSHNAFSRPGEEALLNFQNHGGKITIYQARQLIEMIEKYEDEP